MSMLVLDESWWVVCPIEIMQSSSIYWLVHQTIQLTAQNLINSIMNESIIYLYQAVPDYYLCARPCAAPPASPLVPILSCVLRFVVPQAAVNISIPRKNIHSIYPQLFCAIRQWPRPIGWCWMPSWWPVPSPHLSTPLEPGSNLLCTSILYYVLCTVRFPRKISF